MQKLLDNWRQVAAAVAAVAALVGVTVVVTDSNDDGKPDTITVTVNAKAGDGQPTKTIEAPSALVEQTAPKLEDDLRTLPEPATADQLDRIDKAIADDDSKPLPTAGAVQGFAGCVTRILPTNYSSRPGVRPVWFVLHYTVSHNVPGWGDVNAIISLFSNPGRQASSNFVLDAEGNCAYIVPIEAKAWTQAGGNPWSISVEVIAYGNEPGYLSPAGWEKLKSIVTQVHARTGIPLRRGSVAGGCVPGNAGIVHHKDFGLCGGGHVDITPFDVDDAVRRLTGPAPPSTPLTKTEQRIRAGACHPKGSGHSAGYWRGRASERVDVFDRAHGRGRPWRFHDIGIRRQLLARAAAGKC